MEKFRFIDFDNNLVLVEQTILPAQEKIRNLNLKLPFNFDKVFTIFVFNKDYTWLRFDPHQIDDLPIFSKTVDKIYIFAKIPHNAPIAQMGAKIDCCSLPISDDLFRAIYVITHSLLKLNRQDLCVHLMRSIGDIEIQKMVQTSITSFEKALACNRIEFAVSQPTEGMFVGGRSPHTDFESPQSLIDLLTNLMEHPETKFYPFITAKTDFGFIPDVNYSVNFNQLVWSASELTLYAPVKVPGTYVLPQPTMDLHKVETYSSMEINLIKCGIPCFKKLYVEILGKKGYLDLTEYPMLTEFSPSIRISNICEILHARNLAFLRYKILLYLSHKSRITRKKDVTEKHKLSFAKFDESQRDFLKKLNVFKTTGYKCPHYANPKPPVFNMYEDEFDTLMRNFDVILKACIEGKKFDELKNKINIFIYHLLHELITGVFDVLYNTSTDYFVALKDETEKAYKDFLNFDTYIQKLRFFVTYVSNEIPERTDCEFFSIMHNSFNFLFEIDGCVGYSNAY